MWYRRKSVWAVLGAALAVVVVVASILLLRGPGSPRPAPAAVSPGAGSPLVSPFTGEPVKSPGPVLAVKIDNLAAARPQTGLTRADIVYVLQVEGGLSRFMAVYSSHFPPVIGPVRSAREDDLQLLRQFGRPAFAYSGAHPRLLPIVERARIVDLYSGRVGGYYRVSSRYAPHNLYAHTSQLVAQARGASRPHDIGFRFGPAPGGGRAAPSMSVSYPAASYTFRWSRSAHRWLVWMDGAPARSTEDGQLGAPTVVIQYVKVGTARFLEWGAPAPYSHSTGSGRAVVLRDGKAWTTHWVRPHGRAGTAFTTRSGQRMTFARGQVWVLLVRQ
jgi:Protein of unknown function (DUF3048) N-terminal domain/Protein of unknown function (DUF3048) C-terminal domain